MCQEVSNHVTNRENPVFFPLADPHHSSITHSNTKSGGELEGRCLSCASAARSASPAVSAQPPPASSAPRPEQQGRNSPRPSIPRPALPALPSHHRHPVQHTVSDLNRTRRARSGLASEALVRGKGLTWTARSADCTNAHRTKRWSLADPSAAPSSNRRVTRSPVGSSTAAPQAKASV